MLPRKCSIFAGCSNWLLIQSSSNATITSVVRRLTHRLTCLIFRDFLGAFVYQLGHGPLKAERRVRFPYALPILPGRFPHFFFDYSKKATL